MKVQGIRPTDTRVVPGESPRHQRRAMRFCGVQRGSLAVVAAVCLATAAFAVRPPEQSETRPQRKRLPSQRVLQEPSVITGTPDYQKRGADEAELDPNKPRPKIVAVEDAHDFGEIWVGPTLKHTFILRNDGNDVLKIERVKPSCGCTIAGNYPKEIQPGQSGEFPFSINSNKLHGKFEKAITVSSNDPADPSLRLRLRGQVKRYVELVPTNIHFGRLQGNEPVERVVKITSNANQPLQLTLVTPPDLDNLEVDLVATKPGSTYDLRIKAKPPFKPGIIRDTVTLKTNIPNQNEVKVQVRGTVPERLSVTPGLIVVGQPGTAQAAKTPAFTRVLQFTNYGNTPAKVTEAKVDDAAITISVHEQVPDKSYTVQLDFPEGYEPPEEPRTVSLQTNDKDQPVITVPIKGWATRTKKADSKPSRRPAEEMEGKDAPSFSLTTMEGKSLAIPDMNRQVTVLDFFAPNCGFCKKQIPRLEKIRAKYADKGVRFVAVSQTMGNRRYTDEQVVDTIKGLGFHGELAIDSGNTVGPKFKATSYPTMVVLGKQGKVDAVNIGNLADLEKRMETQLDALIAGKSIPDIEKTAKADPKPAPEVAKPVEKVEKKEPPKPEVKQAAQKDNGAAPEFSLQSFDGKTVSSADFAKYPATILNFMAVNCGYCGKQIPRLEKIRQEYEPKGVRFVNVVETMKKKYERKDIEAKMTQLGSKLEVAHDPDNKVGPLYGARGFPTMVVVGKSGKIEARNIGNVGDLETRVRSQLDALIAGKPIPQTAKSDPPQKKRAGPDSLVGQAAPAFSTTTMDGKEVSNNKLNEHSATVLNFVAGNCGFCMKQIPRVEKLREQYAAKGVRFVNVVETMGKPFTTEQVTEKMKTLGSHLEVAHDSSNSVGKVFNVRGFPTMMVVGKDGKVGAANVGNIGDLEQKLTAQLDALIAGKPVPGAEEAKATAPQKPRRRPAEELVDERAPAFSVSTLDGTNISNATFKDHPATVLNFFAPNCGFCKKQIPTVEKIRQEYEAKGILFVNVAQKMRKDYSNDEIKDVLSKVGSNLKLATSDFSKGSVGQSFKAVSFPTMIVVDKSGTIKHVNIGAKKNLEQLLKEQLDALIQG